MPDDGRTTGRQPQPGGGYNYRAGGRRNAVPPELLEARSKRHSEWLLPAAVILAGVLVVVAVGFIVSRSIRNDEPAAVAPVQPPALGEFPATPGNQFPIPLASDSASPSPSLSPSSPSPSASRTTQPSRKERPSDFPGSVSIARTGIPRNVDLSAEGNRDWVHWGEQSTFSLERKSDGAFQILEGAPTAPRFRHGLSPQRFSWTGGAPVDHSDGTPTGIRTCDKGNGFTISAPAATSARTLTIYAGARGARGKLTAKLSVGGASATSTFTEQSNNLATTAFVITYKAPKNGKINLSWITDASFDDDCGGVALEAATLR